MRVVVPAVAGHRRGHALSRDVNGRAEFSAPATCNDVRSGGPLLVTAIRPDAAMFAPVDRLTSFSPATDDSVRSRPATARPGHAASPSAFAIPLRQ